MAERMAINAPIQGTSADIIKIMKMVEVGRKEGLSSKFFQFLQIHDELILKSRKMLFKSCASD